MKIDYFIRKQELLLSKISTNYIRESYFNIVNSDERLVGLIGSRGVGKTTLLFQYIKLSHTKALYMSGDDIEFTNSRIYDLVDEFYTLGGRVVVIDEVHKCPVSQRYTSFQKVISLNILGKILNISGLILNQLSTASNGVLTFNSFLKLPCLLLKL